MRMKDLVAKYAMSGARVTVFRAKNH